MAGSVWSRKPTSRLVPLVVYCEIDSFLPVRPAFEFLRQSSFRRMGGEEGFCLRTIKLRGQNPQGLLPVLVLDRPTTLEEDVTAELGIKLYVAPVHACLAGEVIGPFPAKVSKTDEKRIQNLAGD